MTHPSVEDNVWRFASSTILCPASIVAFALRFILLESRKLSRFSKRRKIKGMRELKVW